MLTWHEPGNKFQYGNISFAHPGWGNSAIGFGVAAFWAAVLLALVK